MIAPARPRRTAAASMLPTLALALTLAPASLGQRIDYPDTRTVDQTDTYHGTQVADPYRWLEDDVRESSDVAEWVHEQNKVTSAYLESLEHRDEIKNRLTELMDYERYSAPSKVAGFYVYSKNDGLQDQAVVYIVDAEDPKAEPRVLLDPNTWSEDGTVALSGMSFSDDGRYLAFGKSASGSDWDTWQVMEVATGAMLPETLEWIKWGGPSWTKDGRGFFYTRFPEPEAGEAFQALNTNSTIYYHQLHTDQADDTLVFEQPAHPEWNLYGAVSEDGRYLLVYASIGTDDRNRLWVRDLADPYAAPRVLVGDFEHKWDVVGNDGPVFYLHTDYQAPNQRVVTFDIRDGAIEVGGDDDPLAGATLGAVAGMGAARLDEDARLGAAVAALDATALTELIPESENPLRSVSLTGNMLVCTYFKDVLNQVRMFRTDGTHVRDVEFPGVGVAAGFGGKREHTETFYTFSSPTTPPSIYRYDLITAESELFRRAEVDFDPDRFEVTQAFYRSKDGTRVPMFIAHRKGISLDGNNPTLLYGYGGFNIPMQPYFSTTRIAWMEMGGVYAIANIRGGGEYGNEWHDAGTKLNKQNVFDDFIAAAEHLIDEGYTRPEKLAIQGGSNGGLLVGAVITQRPDLFGAALPAVGVMDMLRFHKFTAGRYWVDDYGSSDDPGEFEALYAYSPYHQALRQKGKGMKYPATLVTTADTDDRVVPGHSFKFAAALQQAQAGQAPILIRIETKAGHGAGKPTTKIIEEYADMWAFLAENLDMEPELGRD